MANLLIASLPTHCVLRFASGRLQGTNGGATKSMMLAFFRAIWVILRKDIRIWLRRPSIIGATLIPPIGFLLVGALGAAAVGRSPVALVTLAPGARGQQMARIIHNADVFRITDATPSQAQSMLSNIDVVAIITIPADFSRRA